MTTEYFNTLRSNYNKIMEQISKAAIKSNRQPSDITLVAVTKTVQPEIIDFVVSLGVKIIGENRTSELTRKQNELKEEPQFHLIGHLQTNKVKDIVGKIHLLQSLDSIKLAKKLNDEYEKISEKLPVLIQINISNEASKTGFLESEVPFALEEFKKFKNLQLKGLMAIPEICDTYKKTHYFNRMLEQYIDISQKIEDNIDCTILSMGMSHDYYDAILNGANMVRIGTELFLARDYSKI